MKKKGVSPVIATILLIVLVVIIGAIIFTWFKGMTQEAVTKFEGTNIQLVCEDVGFTADYSNGILIISNNGNVPIYSIDVKMEGPGSYKTKEITDASIFGTEWPGPSGLLQGARVSINIDMSNYEQITLIPILMGLNKEGIKKTEACDERHGEIIFI